MVCVHAGLVAETSLQPPCVPAAGLSQSAPAPRGSSELLKAVSQMWPDLKFGVPPSRQSACGDASAQVRSPSLLQEWRGYLGVSGAKGEAPAHLQDEINRSTPSQRFSSSHCCLLEPWFGFV